MAGPFDFSQPALSPGYGGALSGFLPQQPQGILNDPTTAALLSVAGSFLSAGGPQRFPVGTGQALGQAIQNGVGTFGAVQRSNAQNAFNQFRMGVLAQQAHKLALDNALTESLVNGGNTGNLTPDQLEAYGTRLAAAGHPGGATLIDRAQRMRIAQQNASAVESFRSSPGSLGAGVTPNSPQGRALLGNLTGDQDFDQSVLAAQNDALNANAQPQMPAQPVSAPNPGLFGSLMTSPYVGDSARAMQRMVDTAPPQGVSPTTVLSQYEHLAQLHQAGLNAQENRDLRRQLVGEQIANRNAQRENLQGQRLIQNEDRLAREYDNNPTVKEYQNRKPLVSTTADYMLGGKYDSSGDRALAFTYAKMLDPGDRVGVNDLKDISKLGNVPERIVQAVQSLAEGKMLPDRVRQEMFQVIRNRFGSLNEQQTQIEDEFEGRAKSRMLNPANVVIRYGARRQTPPAPSHQTPTTPTRGKVVDFNSLPK